MHHGSPTLQVRILFVAQLRVLVHGPSPFLKITSMLLVMPMQPIFEMREAHTDVGFHKEPTGSDEGSDRLMDDTNVGLFHRSPEPWHTGGGGGQLPSCQ